MCTLGFSLGVLGVRGFFGFLDFARVPVIFFCVSAVFPLGFLGFAVGFLRFSWVVQGFFNFSQGLPWISASNFVVCFGLNFCRNLVVTLKCGDRRNEKLN